MISTLIKLSGPFIIVCLALLISGDFLSLPPGDLSTAKCRASCLYTFSGRLRTNLKESCSSLQSCSTCWETCDLLFHATLIWSPICNTKICDGGCRIACKYWLLHKKEDPRNNISGSSNFERIPICIVNGNQTLFYWSAPTGFDGNKINSTIVYAIFMEEHSDKNTSVTKSWKQLKQTPSSSANLRFPVLPTKSLCLVAFNEDGVIASVIFHPHSITFPEFFRQPGFLDEGLVPINEFLWASPRSKVSAFIEEKPASRTQLSMFWHGPMNDRDPFSVYKVLWRMLTCNVYQELERCYLHSHYNVTLISLNKKEQARLKINLRFNSQYVIQVERIRIGLDRENSGETSNSDATLIIAETPQCSNPDKSFFICKSRLTQQNTTKVYFSRPPPFSHLSFTAFVLSVFCAGILIILSVSLGWNKIKKRCFQKPPIRSINNNSHKTSNGFGFNRLDHK